MMEKTPSELAVKNANPEEAKMNDDSKEKSLATDDGLSNTPYDDVFRTVINDARELVLPLLNEIFGDHYTGKEKIEFAQDTHMIQQSDQKMKRRITDSSFSVIGEERKRYLMEAMSTPDIAFRCAFSSTPHRLRWMKGKWMEA